MLVKELLEKTNNTQYENIEIYEADPNYNHGFYGDFMRLVADVNDLGEMTTYRSCEVLDYEEMDIDRYMETIEANSCITKDDYDFNGGKVLVIKISEFEAAEASFGGQVKGAREELGYTQSDLAGVLSVPYRTLQDWEAGRHEPAEWTKQLVLDKLDDMVNSLSREEEVKKISIEKEGIYYTLYINDIQCGCGYLEDLLDELEEHQEDLLEYARESQCCR